MADVLVLGTADWDQAIATNQHYAVRELGREHDVTFVQSMGLRKVELKARDLTRIARRLRGLFAAKNGAPGRTLPERVSVASPRVLPRHRGAIRKLNQASLARQFRDWATSSQTKVLWLYSPLDYGLAQHADLVVYHCVDLLATVPGIDGDVILEAESKLASTGRVIAAGSSPAVVAHLESIGFQDTLFWPNVADTSVFSTDVNPDGKRRSAAVFAGNLSETKVDFDLLAEVLAGGIELHLAGPIAEGGGDARGRVGALVAQGAMYHGLLDLPALAMLQRSCSVGLIPYVANDYTAGVSPLKTYEYLASGLAVVSTGVPSVEQIDGHVCATRRDAFLDTVHASAQPPDSATVDVRRQIAGAHSWSGRGEEMRSIISSNNRSVRAAPDDAR